MAIREVTSLLPGIPSSDGAGVKLLRSLGARPSLRLDPFLMLDEFGSNEANDYIAGFPAHPHRGFETVTYMREGHMLHEDHLGNRGHLRSGGVQWMSAAHGIIHSEMPQQQAGRMHGFQLWINLPAREKMKPASYRDIPAEKIPTVQLGNGTSVTVIAGELTEQPSLRGPIQGLSTQPLYLDVHLPEGQRFSQAIPAHQNAFVYVYEGALQIGAVATTSSVKAHAAALLGPGDELHVKAEHEARFLVLAGTPLNEPVVQYGPFVMNTREEIEQAVLDYQTGNLVQGSAIAAHE